MQLRRTGRLAAAELLAAEDRTDGILARTSVIRVWRELRC